MKWSSSYEQLRATNVHSTVQMLKLALAGAACTYVSGGNMHLSESAVVDDSSRLSSANGYSQSKFASDILVHQCISRAPAGQCINMVGLGIILARQPKVFPP